MLQQVRHLVNITEGSWEWQVVRYSAAGFHDAHHDAKHFDAKHRWLTLLAYLNTPTLGGETWFAPSGNSSESNRCSDVGTNIRAVKGSAVLFYNYDVKSDSTYSKQEGVNGERDQDNECHPDVEPCLSPQSLHAGCMVGTGEKWISTHWLGALDLTYRPPNEIFNQLAPTLDTVKSGQMAPNGEL